MGLRLLAICLAFGGWVALGRAQDRLGPAPNRWLVGALAGLRGGTMGLVLSLFLATAMTQAAGPRGAVPYFFPTLALGMSMLGVSFGLLIGVLKSIRSH